MGGRGSTGGDSVNVRPSCSAASFFCCHASIALRQVCHSRYIRSAPTSIPTSIPASIPASRACLISVLLSHAANMGPPSTVMNAPAVAVIIRRPVFCPILSMALSHFQPEISAVTTIIKAARHSTAKTNRNARTRVAGGMVNVVVGLESRDWTET